jgi:CBS-domain-containing membrane protein
VNFSSPWRRTSTRNESDLRHIDSQSGAPAALIYVSTDNKPDPRTGLDSDDWCEVLDLIDAVVDSITDDEIEQRMREIVAAAGYGARAGECVNADPWPYHRGSPLPPAA